jgi:phage gp45-like
MSGRRFEFDGTIAEEGGQQFVNGRGAYGQGFTRVHRPEPHGFASQPIKGSKGLILSPNAQSDEAYVFGGEHPEKRPTGLPAGATALYDASGNIIKLVGNQIEISGNTVWAGNLTITGNLHVNGNITASGSIIDQGGNTANHSH